MINKETLIKQEKDILYNRSVTSNPISGTGFMPRMNVSPARTTSNRLYGGYNLNNNDRVFATVDYKEVIYIEFGAVRGVSGPNRRTAG